MVNPNCDYCRYYDKEKYKCNYHPKHVSAQAYDSCMIWAKKSHLITNIALNVVKKGSIILSSV